MCNFIPLIFIGFLAIASSTESNTRGIVDLISQNITGDHVQVQVPCWPVDFSHGSVVCQCNSTYCDNVLQVRKEDLTPGSYYEIVSSKTGSRFATSIKKLDSSHHGYEDAVIISINRSVTFQTLEGFGGAFTDATGLNIASLSETLQETLIKQYFDDATGLNYIFARVPMAGTDFSIRTYSYDDYEDTDLAKFELQTEDLTYKIPFIQQALQYQPRLKLFASPWSAPPWMKTNNAFFGKGSLKPEYSLTWANYFLKFLSAYASHNVSFWGVTAQNEPTSGNLLDYPFNCMGWSAEEQRDWIKNYLGPVLRNSSFSQLKIIMLDDDRINLATWPDVILSDPVASEYISGIGVHWYTDAIVSSRLLQTTHERHPTKWLLATEASAGFLNTIEPVILGSWERAELYGYDIISDMNNWVVGWVDWNLALNTSGGPNWAGNEVDAPIIVDYTQNVFYKQPMFYAIGHFSKFIPSGSQRILWSSQNLNGLSVLACQRPDGLVVIVAMNQLTEQVRLQIRDSGGAQISTDISPNSIYTIIYN